jgi:DNA polymerase-1
MTKPTAAPLHLYLIDGSGYIFRAFHALPALTRASDGMPVGAVAGFCNMVWKLLREVNAGERPTHLAVVFDKSEDTFRKAFYPDYKAHRPPPPPDLAVQFPVIREATKAFGLPSLELSGYEADDLIATYARLAVEAGGRATIISSDKDLMQLIRPGVALFDPMKSRPLGEPEVLEKFGVTPDKVIDVQALAGDSVDNVPGAPGIGVKTAAELINTYGDLESLLARAGEIKQPKRRETLMTHADQIRISKRLVALDDRVPLSEPMDALALDDPDPAQLTAFLEQMEFKTLTRRVREAFPGVPAAAAPARHGGPAGPPEEAAGEAAGPMPDAGVDYERYETVSDLAALDRWIAKAFAAGVVAVDTETDALSATASGLVGISLAVASNDACYIPLAHHAAGEAGRDLFARAEAPAPPMQIPAAEAIARLKPLLEDASILKVGQNIKYDLGVLARVGVRVAPYDDTMLISYVLETGKHGHGMDELSELFLGHKPIAFRDVAGSGKAQVSFDCVGIDAATRYAGEDADITLRLWRVLKPRLARAGLLGVYETLERHMPRVLSDMELAGVKVDLPVLSRLSGLFSQRMAGLEDEAHKLAGKAFNLASPKQIGDILFGDMNLPGGKRTATGVWSTDADTLEDLAASGVALARVLLDWRQLAKLKGTYTDALRDAVNAKTGRVHTSFALAATTTGRLSSSEPNLQNIPIRTEEGRKIREAFVAEAGHVLISADYSQIELRLLAHVAGIESLRKAFRDGLDIHAMTASEMFGVPIKGMDPMVRRRAKAINFGIIYGISAFGLANQLAIPQSEAADYIKSYFQKFPGIRDYMETTKATAREKGYVETIFGRRCHIRDIAAKAMNQRAFAERQAINAPLQGAAADVIRRAMARIPGALAGAGLATRMLLQVHDELVFEAPQSEAEAACRLVARVMEQAAEPAVRLSVPLVVEARAAASWAGAH